MLLNVLIQIAAIFTHIQVKGNHKICKNPPKKKPTLIKFYSYSYLF